MKTLLHACCGPCASACVPALRDLGDEVVLFFSNANIDTYDEFMRRLEAVRKLADAEDVPLVVDPYDHETWLVEVAAGYEQAPEKGARCARCFRYSLVRTAAYAAAHGFDAFTTSLTVSPHKVSATVFEAGREAQWAVSAAPCGGGAAAPPLFRACDFKKKNGFLRACERSAALGLYRQAYCGCAFGRR